MIRVLVVEDSPSVRDFLVRLLESDGGFTVVGTASDGEKAVALAARLQPDVITMDIHLPSLDGVEATRRIMGQTPTPVVIVSTSVEVKTEGLAFEALRAGAVAVLDKPPGPGHPRHVPAVRELLTTVRLMADVKVVRRWATTGQPASPPALSSAGTASNAATATDGPRPRFITLAASTGGPPAIQTVLRGLGRDVGVPVLIVQHMSHGFIEGLAAWLAATCPQTVRLACQGDVPSAGTINLAPEARHLLLTRRGTLALSSAPPVRGFRPSANVLFESVAESCGAHALGVVLTGMGDDGAAGLAALQAAGALTIAQDEATSVVYGMPRAAASVGAATHVLPLTAIAPTIRRHLGLNDLPDRALPGTPVSRTGITT